VFRPIWFGRFGPTIIGATSADLGRACGRPSEAKSAAAARVAQMMKVWAGLEASPSQ
jgi:hypothetical protein